jgi:phage antirepressor YoqD-like protein
MSAAETVKDFARIAATAGLSKEVIGLLDKKAALLAEQVAMLEKDNAALAQENTTLLRENRNLHLVNEDLKKQLENARPKGNELDEGCKQMLVALANFTGGDGITRDELIQWLRLPKVKGERQFDQLRERDFVKYGGFGDLNRGFPVFVTAAGREYMANNGLLESKPPSHPPPQRPLSSPYSPHSIF